MRIITFLAVALSVFMIRPVVTYNVNCSGTELIDIFGNIYAVEDELSEGKYILLLDGKGTETPEDDEVLWVFDNN